jgi:DNA-binding Lrp family transcriptional regulator
MVLSSGDITSKIYRRKVRDDLGDFSLDGQTLLMLMELDGKATLGSLAAKTGLSMGSIRELISKLLKLGLIEKVEKEIIPVDSVFFRQLLDELALAIGPIASVLIEDEVQDLGHDVKTFPSYLVTELVDRLAGEIRREEKKAIFIKNMVNIIRTRGYVNT